MFKTLLVENNLNYRSALKFVLLKRFFNFVTRETSGESDTLKAIDYFNPDLILLDIHLKNGINGLNLIKTIKLKRPEIVVAILSQHDVPEYRSASLQYGADAFISKSSSLETIFTYVQSVVKRKQELPGVH